MSDIVEDAGAGDIEMGSRTQSTPSISIKNADTGKKKKTIEEKKEIIERFLKSSFPALIVGHFALSLIEIGLASIAIQISLMAYHAPLYKMANGIWGGFLAVVNGMVKLNLYRKRDYASFVIFQAATLILAIGTSVGLIALTADCLSKYPCPENQGCTTKNHALTIGLHVLGHVAFFSNIFSVILINTELFGGFKNAMKNRLGFFEAYKELFHVLKGSRK